MSVVLPESMNKLDLDKVQDSLKTIENYIHYIEERIDYFTTITKRATTTEIENNVNESANRITLEYKDELQKYPTKTELTNTLENLQNSVKTEIGKVQDLLQASDGVFKILEDNGVNTGWTITSNDGTKVIKAGANGIGISNDGGQTFASAITGDGVVANSMIIGDSNLERFVSVEQGVIRIGNENNNIQLKLESDSIGFYNQQGRLLAKFTSNGLMFAPDSFQSIQMGNYTIKARNDGSIYFD